MSEIEPVVNDLVKMTEMCVEKDKEIERLNNIIKEQGLEDKPNYYVKGLEGSLKEYQEEVKSLNNIIIELEKWLGESIEKHTEDYLDWKYDRNVYLAGSKKLQNVLDKLQELKGSESNE